VGHQSRRVLRDDVMATADVVHRGRPAHPPTERDFLPLWHVRRYARLGSREGSEVEVMEPLNRTVHVAGEQLETATRGGSPPSEADPAAPSRPRRTRTRAHARSSS
jgi:hypothetical protein